MVTQQPPGIASSTDPSSALPAPALPAPSPSPHRHWTEQDRLEALARYHILDSLPDTELEDIVQLASSILDAPIAMITLIDHDRQRIKASVGVSFRDLPLDVSICAQILREPGVVVLPDLPGDQRFAANPALLQVGARFYAGAPLLTSDGLPLGRLCVLDVRDRPAVLTPAQTKALNALSRQVMTQLELRRMMADSQRALANQRASDIGRIVATERLVMSEEILRLSTEAAEVGTWSVDLLTNKLTWSDRTRAMFGIHGPSDTMENFYNGLHPDHRVATSEAFARAVDPALRETYDVEYRTIGRDDRVVRWVAAKGRAIFDEDGRCIRAIGTAIDISARKQDEERLRHSESMLAESEAKFRAITDSIDQMVWSTLPDGTRDFYNQRWYEYTGLPPGSLDGDAWAGLLHPDDEAAAREVWQRSRFSSEPYRIEYRLRNHAGQYRWVLARAQPQRGPDGQVIRWYGTCTSIQELVQARDVLARSRRELEQEVAKRTAERDQVWRNARDLLLVIDAHGTFRSANPAWTAVLGWRPHQVVGCYLLDFIHPDDSNAAEAAHAQAHEGLQPGYEARFRHRDGHYRIISWVLALQQTVLYASGRDVTDEREAAAALAETQEQLRQAQKMDAVGQLTGGIAHDFNNMLAVVIGSLDLLGRRLPRDAARERRYVDAAMEGARRAAALTQRLLAFSRQQPLQPVTLDVNALVSGMSELLRHSLGSSIRLQTALAGELWRTHADPNQLENVLLNLAVNARDAMEDEALGGGRLTIETQNTHLDSSYAESNPGVAAGQYVLVSVTDNGRGMSEAVMARAFDPFFTTKEVGRGTGLGLSQAYGFLKQSGGHVKLYSELGHGTTVKVYLPRLQSGDMALPPEPAEAALPRGTAREVVLVVEDEPGVRSFSVEALTGLGYRVLEADNAVAGLRLLDSAPDVALLFTDVVMPEVNGRKLADEALRRRPGLRVLFTTGYTRDAVVNNGVLDPGVSLLGKPFTVASLAVKVRAVLDAPA